MVLNPLKIEEKFSRKKFFTVCPATKSPLFWTKKAWKFFLGAVGIGSYLGKKFIKKKKVAPDTKYGVFRK